MMKEIVRNISEFCFYLGGVALFLLALYSWGSLIQEQQNREFYAPVDMPTFPAQGQVEISCQNMKSYGEGIKNGTIEIGTPPCEMLSVTP